MSGTSGKTENKQSLLSLENVLSATGGVTEVNILNL